MRTGPGFPPAAALGVPKGPVPIQFPIQFPKGPVPIQFRNFKRNVLKPMLRKKI